MKILLTGGAGYIGSILTGKLLKRNYQVTIVDNLYYNIHGLYPYCSDENFDFIRGDVRDQVLISKLVTKHDIIIPLAAIVGMLACNNDRVTAEAVNYQAIKFLNKVRSTDQPIIYPCTNSGYGTKSNQVYCTEETPLEPISLYGRTKVEAEKVLLDCPNTISLRFATLFGVSARMRLDLLVNDFVYRAVKDRFIVLFEEHFRRNYIHIRDVAGVFSFGIDNFSNMKGQSFNVGLSTANLTKMQLCERIKDHVPTFEIYVSAIGKDPDQRDYVVSNEKIESLGWAPRYTLDNGINELVKGYQIVKPNIYANA